MNSKPDKICPVLQFWYIVKKKYNGNPRTNTCLQLYKIRAGGKKESLTDRLGKTSGSQKAEMTTGQHREANVFPWRKSVRQKSSFLSTAGTGRHLNGLYSLRNRCWIWRKSSLNSVRFSQTFEKLRDRLFSLTLSHWLESRYFERARLYVGGVWHLLPELAVFDWKKVYRCARFACYEISIVRLLLVYQFMVIN